LYDAWVLDAGRAAVKVVAMTTTEIIFEVREDEVDGGYNARAPGHDIFTQGDMLDDVRAMMKDAVACHFSDKPDRPQLIRLHFVRDEVLAA
jgi:hypothetical protein